MYLTPMALLLQHEYPRPPCADAPLDMYRDFIDCVGRNVTTAPERVFGEFDSRVLTQRALEIVAAHEPEESLYLYLAFHNVHEPQQAPVSPTR